MSNLSRWIEVTFVLIILYLVLSRAAGFSSAISAVSRAYTDAVRSLQGR